MPEHNTVSNSFDGPVHNLEEGILGMKIENENGSCDEKGGCGGGSSPPSPYPNRPGELDCIHYLRTGLCGYGSKCCFNHPSHDAKNEGELPQRPGRPDCGFYIRTGGCKFGPSCKYHHPNDRESSEQPPLNSLGLPIRQDMKCCWFYMRTYTCKFGIRCKFNHPEPSSAETAFPVAGASTYGAINSSAYPSVGMPYANGLSSCWLLPRPPYLSTYAPPVIPSSQTAQGWSTYVGTLPPTNFYGTNLYNVKDQGLGMNVPFNHSATISGLPERPDQPECRYFMSNGSCKYGYDCIYHHPKEKIAQLLMYSLGPHGLPLRPGEAMCSHFRIHGVCKYGTTCKYDHPIAGYFSTYGFNVQQDQPFIPYKRNSSIKNCSDSSPSKSSTISDWIQKPEPVDDNNGYPDGAKSVLDPPQEPTSTTTTSSEVSRDQ